MKRRCCQCGRDFNGTAKNATCYNCRALNDSLPPIPVGGKRWSSQSVQQQNLPRVDADSLGYTGLQATFVILDDLPAPSDFTGGGGDFGGGGAGGSW